MVGPSRRRGTYESMGVMRSIGISRITAVNSRHAQVVPESRDGKNGNCQNVAADQRGPHNLGDGLVTVF